MSIPSRNRLVAFARIVSTVRCDAANILIRRDLVKKIREHWGIADAAAGHLNCPYLQCLLINPPLGECTIRLPGNGCVFFARGGV